MESGQSKTSTPITPPKAKRAWHVPLCLVVGVLVAHTINPVPLEMGTPGQEGRMTERAETQEPKSEDVGTQSDRRKEALARLQEQKNQLDRQRAELAGLAQDSPQAKELEEEFRTEAERFYTALVEFLTDPDFPMIEGDPLTAVQQQAIRMKSDEDLLIAQEYIEKGGNYRKAISIYESALQLDPNNAKLQKALEEAKAKRFMDKERFSRVEPGMTEDEVREVLGQPNLYNIKEFDQQGQKVTAWYYPKNAQGAAAAVWFRPQDGELRVYQADFDAIAGQ